MRGGAESAPGLARWEGAVSALMGRPLPVQAPGTCRTATGFYPGAGEGAETAPGGRPARGGGGGGSVRTAPPPRPPLAAAQAVQINRKARRAHLHAEPEAPVSIERDKQHAVIVGWQLDTWVVENYNAVPPERADEVTHLEDDILAGTTVPGLGASFSAFIVTCGNDYRECVIAGCSLELLDDRLSAIRLLLKKGRRFTGELVDRPRDFVLSRIVPVNQEDAPSFSPLRTFAGRLALLNFKDRGLQHSDASPHPARSHLAEVRIGSPR